MNRETTRRGVLAAALVASVAGLSLSAASDLLEQFAPLSGDAWDAAGREHPDRVDNPYGEATVRIDDEGVPHVEADDERAAYFAIGYLHGFDRAFQLDLQRRQMRGELSAIFGVIALESDEFHARMDFVGAAEATWETVKETHAGSLIEPYSEGVNAAVENHRLPLEFELLGYDPDPWTPVETLLMEKQISWGLTGNFRALRRELIETQLEADLIDALYPDRMDHDVPILRTESEHVDDLGELRGVRGRGEAENDDQTAATDRRERVHSSGSTAASDSTSTSSSTDSNSTSTADEPDTTLLEWLSQFESPPGVGSNSWVVSGENTENGTPILANDPHLELMTPPLWYEQHIDTPETDVRGVTFPGVPFVIIGANQVGAWGVTNVGADVLDCYTYEIDDEAERYRYEGEWREFDLEERELVVSGGENRTFTVRKTVHGPLLEREGQHVGVSWTGLTATRTTQAVYELGVSEGVDDALEAARKFDLPTQNLLYADSDGRTLYVATGQLPIRHVDGEVVDGNRVFDGSAGEGEWGGFTPYGRSTWDGFVPFDERPTAIDPTVVATANQRVVDDPEHYVGVAYAAPYRGRRIYDVLDEATDANEATDVKFHKRLQTDTRDERAVDLVPDLLAIGHSAIDAGLAADPETLEDALEILEGWDYRMDRDSHGALLFARWIEHYREAVLDPLFEDTDLDEGYYPNDWVVTTLPEDSPVFANRSRAELLVTALEEAVSELEDEEWETYGDWNTTAPIGHPLGGEAAFLNYDERQRDGSRATVDNYRVERSVGASWRMVVEPGGDGWGILPGGNSGDYFSPHYDDQFARWADGTYKPMALEADGETSIQFDEPEREFYGTDDDGGEDRAFGRPDDPGGAE
ncbi:penicillin acylase family protein [Natronosalvus vescus]|uniref:penicillin acylase family protein n=1 Tax=Natronosalvus vescus TaxID=2953881 RepID=UPI00209054BE|nr:penicillin acylase family protein [Natronosalvus vescus]